MNHRKRWLRTTTLAAGTIVLAIPIPPRIVPGSSVQNVESASSREKMKSVMARQVMPPVISQCGM